MNYSPNHQLFSSVFVLPAAITDEHLKLASGAQLKVILTIFRSQNEAFDIHKIAQKTGLPVQEVQDCCAFWAQKGVLTDLSAPLQAFSVQMPVACAQTATDNKTDAISPAQSLVGEEQKQQPCPPSKRQKIDAAPGKPTREQICMRLDECAELRELFNETQAVLGRMLGTGDQASLLLLHDYYGLPCDVVLMLCEYARSMGKSGNLNYIYAVGRDWSEREIDTFERADEELRRLAQVDEHWTQLCNLTGLRHDKPTKKQQAYMQIWLQEWHFSVPMIALAFEKMKEYTDSVRFSYMNGILKNWQAKGISTTEQAQAEDREFLEKQTARSRKTSGATNAADDGISPAVAKSGTADTPASYDLAKAEQIARSTVPTLKKRKKT